MTPTFNYPFLNEFASLNLHNIRFIGTVADMQNSYRIQTCFSIKSMKILVNSCYFCDLWRILECKSLWITHIFAIYSDLSVVSIVMVISAVPNHQYWWFLVWFIRRITKFFANSSDFYSDYICFFASTLAQFGYHF